ncbi:hypothetical protein Tco_0719121 [Tanacetum coccineum]
MIDTKEHEKRHKSRRSRTSVFSRIRRERSRSPRQRSKEGDVFKRLGSRGKSVSARSDNYSRNSHSKYTEALSESEDSEGGHWKSRSKKKKSHREEDDFIKTERWAMPTWCHMFNSTLTGNARVWFDDLPPESIDSYDDVKKAGGRRQPQITNGRKHFHHGNNMKAAKSKISKKEVSGTNKGRKGSMVGFPYSQKPPKEIFALDKGKFKAPPPMTTPVEKRNHAKFCEFHFEAWHNTDECMHLKKHIEEMLKARKLSHLIKELKQNNEKEQPKVVKKG